MTATVARPAAVHAIRDGRFVCLGTPDCACRWYPECACDFWPCEHGVVQQDRCWITDWVNGPSYLHETHRSIDYHLEQWPDGEVEFEFLDAECLVWWYVDDKLNEPLLYDEDVDGSIGFGGKVALTVIIGAWSAAMFHQELSRWWS